MKINLKRKAKKAKCEIKLFDCDNNEVKKTFSNVKNARNYCSSSGSFMKIRTVGEAEFLPMTLNNSIEEFKL